MLVLKVNGIDRRWGMLIGLIRAILLATVVGRLLTLMFLRMLLSLLMPIMAMSNAFLLVLLCIKAVPLTPTVLIRARALPLEPRSPRMAAAVLKLVK